MGKVHVVSQGEHLSSIAAHYRFLDYKLIWEHPQNDALRARRQSPNLLLPGDLLFVPDKASKVDTAPTDAKHRFVVELPRLRLRLAFLDFHGRPLTQASCAVEAEGAVQELSTDGDGVAERVIPRKAAVGVVQFGEDEFPIHIGSLDPVDAESGWRARLVNLGYLDVDVFGDDELALRAALEEFQCDHDLKVNGTADAATLEALKTAYGC